MGAGERKGTFNVKFDHINNKSLYSVATNGDLYLNFAWLMDNEAGADAVRKLGPKLKRLRGFNLPENYSEKYITIPLARWVNQVKEFTAIVDDIVRQEGDSRSNVAGDEETLVARPVLITDKRIEDEIGIDDTDDSIEVARIDEPVVAISIGGQYPNSKNADDLYNITRGTWRIDRQRAKRAKYAFAVYKGVIKEVYKIVEWRRASRELYAFFARLAGSQPSELPPDFDDGRSEFVGELAPEAVRQRYVGRQLPKRHSQNPILYFNC
jgi:hypothetical protein